MGVLEHPHQHAPLKVASSSFSADVVPRADNDDVTVIGC